MRLKLRPRVWGVLSIFAALGVAAHFGWQHRAPLVAQHSQYVLTAEGIHITPPPPWIRSDIKTQVLRDSGLVGTTSVLEDWGPLSKRIKDAFEFHPWVASVERITKRLPAALEIELKYRRPIAAVESRDPSGVTFLPIDANAVRLPENDLTDAERRYLPRISGVTGRPLVGDVWTDQRVIGGAKLIAALSDVWQQLKMVEIISALQSTSEEAQNYTFDIITTGGTRIVWGAAPGQEATGSEQSAEQKRNRLLEYAKQHHGQLDSIDGPAAIDVRSEIVVTPRTARRKDGPRHQ